MSAHAAEDDRDGKTLCRFIMGDLLDWSTRIDDPRIHAERAALSAAYARLAGAVYAASSERRQAFLNVYPPYGVVTRRGLDIVETAYPHRTRPAASAPTIQAEPAQAAANDAARAPIIEAGAEQLASAQSPSGRRAAARLGAKIPGKGPQRDPRIAWIDPRNGRRLFG